jgi:hypothetical protein
MLPENWCLDPELNCPSIPNLPLLTDSGSFRLFAGERKAMKTTQAWVWLAAGVVALGLNGFYHDGGAEWARRTVDRVASRSAAVLALASGRAEQFLSRTQLVLTPDEVQSCRVASAIAQLQSRAARGQAGFARVEAMSAREEAAVARLEANRARFEAQVARVQVMPALSAVEIPAVCPRRRTKIRQIEIPQIEIPPLEIPEVNVPAPPEVHMGTSTGPI